MPRVFPHGRNRPKRLPVAPVAVPRAALHAPLPRAASIYPHTPATRRASRPGVWDWLAARVMAPMLQWLAVLPR